jgi:hypothetical protein
MAAPSGKAKASPYEWRAWSAQAIFGDNPDARRCSLESTMAAPSGRAKSLALRAARVVSTSDLRD